VKPGKPSRLKQRGELTWESISGGEAGVLISITKESVLLEGQGWNKAQVNPVILRRA